MARVAEGFGDLPAGSFDQSFSAGTSGGSFFDFLGEDSSFGRFINNPNNQALLAEVGASLDPEGLAGAIGKPTLRAIQSRATQKALGEQEKKRKSKLDIMEAIKLLGPPNPANQRGVNTVSQSSKGVKLDFGFGDAPATGLTEINPLGVDVGAENLSNVGDALAPEPTAEGGGGTPEIRRNVNPSRALLP